MAFRHKCPSQNTACFLTLSHVYFFDCDFKKRVSDLVEEYVCSSKTVAYDTANRMIYAGATENKIKVYVAGPDVFLPNYNDIMITQREIVKKFNLDNKIELVFPVESEVNLDEIKSLYKKGLAIRDGNKNLIKSCDCVIANLSSINFRLFSMVSSCEEVIISASSVSFLLLSAKAGVTDRANTAVTASDTAATESTFFI